ncbi:ABC-2 family transporter protein [compost metagenome]
MFNLIRADLFKLRKTWTIRIVIGITAISALIMAMMAYLIPQGKIEASMTGIGFMFSDVNMISILGAVLAGISICGDFDNKTIHNAVANGISRSTVIVSKAIILACSLALILLPYAIITTAALGSGSDYNMGSVAVGFLHLLTSEAGSGFSAAEIWKLLAVMLTLIIVYAAQLSICVPLAFLLKKPVLVVAIYYGLSILSAQLAGLANSSQAFNRIFALTPFGGNYTFLTLDAAGGDLFKAITVSLVFTIVILAFTCVIFRRSEMK